MMKFYVAIFSIVLIVNTCFAQNSHSDMYKSEEYQKMITDNYPNVKDNLPDLSATQVINRIQEKINEGYVSVANKNGLQGYIDEINQNRSDKEKIKEIFYYSSVNAIPPSNMMMDSEEKIDEQYKKSELKIQEVMGLNAAELDMVINHIKSQK